jgi:hypothetical protein
VCLHGKVEFMKMTFARMNCGIQNMKRGRCCVISVQRCELWASCRLLLATCYLLLATCYLLLATCYLLLATCYLLALVACDCSLHVCLGKERREGGAARGGRGQLKKQLWKQKRYKRNVKRNHNISFLISHLTTTNE